MPYKGTPKDIKIPEDVYYRYMSVKGKHTHKETVEAMVNLVQLVGKMLNTKKIDAVSVEREFKELARQEGLI